MIIGIDGNEANVKRRVGSNVYAYELLRYFQNLGTSTDQPLQFRIYLKQFWQSLLPPRSPNWEYAIFGPGFLWTQWRLPLKLYLERLAPNVFFTPGHYAPRWCPVPSVISIMDLAFLSFPNEFRARDLRQLTAWTAYSVRQATHIFAISEATKKDILHHYQIPQERVSVTYPDLNQVLEPQSPQDNSFAHFQKFFGITPPYLLYVGTLQPRKNILRLVEAFAKVKQASQFKEVKLVIVGKRGWLYQDIFQRIQELSLGDQVVFTGFVTDYEKFELMSHAQAVVLPSLYEGFGLPVVEAMSVRTPVLISRVSSLPEVGGEAAHYIDDPTSVTEIADKLVKMLQLSGNERMAVKAACKKQSEKFSWKSCGEVTLDRLMKIGSIA